MSDISCSIQSLKKNQRRGTLDECIKKRQIRYYGIEKVDMSKAKKAKPGKNELTRDKIMAKISALRGKVKNLTSKMMNAKKEDEKEQFKSELNKATNELTKYRELYTEIEKKPKGSFIKIEETPNLSTQELLDLYAPKGGAKKPVMANKEDFTSSCFNNYLNMKKGELNKIVKSMDKTIPVSKLKKAQLLCILLSRGQPAQPVEEIIQEMRPRERRGTEVYTPEQLAMIEQITQQYAPHPIESFEPSMYDTRLSDDRNIRDMIEQMRQEYIPQKQQAITIDEPMEKGRLTAVRREFANRAKHTRKVGTKAQISSGLIPHTRINTDDIDKNMTEQNNYIISVMRNIYKFGEAADKDIIKELIKELNKIALSIQEDKKILDKTDRISSEWSNKYGMIYEKEYVYFALKEQLDKIIERNKPKPKESNKPKESKKPKEVAGMPVFNTKLKKQIKDLKALRKKQKKSI